MKRTFTSMTGPPREIEAQLAKKITWKSLNYGGEGFAA
jgi:hypothetical protein